MSLLVAAYGLVLGSAARFVDYFFPRWIGNIGGLWFLAAFLVGRSVEPALGAMTGAASSLLIACVTYYAWRVFLEGTISTEYLVTVGVFWLAISSASGAVAGHFGGRARTRPDAWSVPAGVLLGESVAVGVLSQRLVQVALQTGVALILLIKSRSRGPAIMAYTLAVTLATALFAISYRSILATL